MRTGWKTILGFALCALLAPARPSAEAARSSTGNAVQRIAVADVPGGVELEIRATRPPSYTVFKLQDPPRLVLDLAGADVSGVASPVEVGKAGVKEVTTAQYSDDKSLVGRVVIALDGAPRYEVSARGESVVVKVEPAPAAPVTAAKPAPDAAPPSSDEEGVVSRRRDETQEPHTATAVLGARPRSGGVLVRLDGAVARFDVLELSGPPRLALDLHDVARAPRSPVALAGPFRQVRFGRDAGRVRVVLDAAGELPRVEVKRVKGGIAVVPVVALASAAATTPAARRAPAGPGGEDLPGAASVASATPARPEVVAIDDLRFSQAGGSARVELTGNPRHAVSRPDPRTLVLTLHDAKLARKLERSLDAGAFPGPVAMMSSFNQSTGDAKVVLSLRADATDSLVETGSGLSWTIAAAGAAGGAGAAGEAEGGAERRALVQADPEPGAEPGGGAAPRRGAYTGRRITLDFHDIDIRNLLRLIADVSKRNIVVADDVTGKVTVSLRNVPWDQALDLVLRSKGLDKEEMGNVIRVAKIEAIAKEQQARAEAAKARAPLVPLKVRLLPVNFARAGDVATRVKDVLSERGTVSTDERTNVLIVKDVPEALARAEGLVRNLDTETPQVRIESRIVEASSNFNRAIGIQWGGTATASAATGNPTGVFFPNTVSVAGASSAATSGLGTPNYAVNLPAPTGEGAGGGVGFTFGSVGGAFNLNLRLSALENSGVVKTISAPSVSTVDNKEATIGQGVSIPFSQVSAGGVNTVFIEAKLELKVTPHVSADGSVLLKIKVTNNAPNPQLTGANGQPSISKREAETEALVKDGETTVIGGIYTRQTSSRVASVPFFADIPILGWFFRNKAENDDHTELLIFITPRIVNRPSAVTAAVQ
jgi:type IV pilus assembly protein PilQ